MGRRAGVPVNLGGFVVSIWLLAAVIMSAGWLWQRRRRNAGIVDVLWAAGLGASALCTGLLSTGELPVLTV